jgi:hypothetical protein
MKALLALALTWVAVRAVPVDNGVEGEPEIECGPTSITVNFNTKNTFEGHVYVKGLYSAADCRNSEGGRRVAGIDLPFSSCNTRRFRSLNPKGVFVSTTVIISFHPLFITKVDRAYRIQCFYMEADKTVDTRLEVSMLTTGFETQFVPMPVCRYELFQAGPNGQLGELVEFAIVGQPIYHKWTCDTETIETFCMVVHSCFVDDTNGDRVDLVDINGCAADLYLLNNPEYTGDLEAGVEAHVFKYADRADLYFQCQITILVKEPGAECPRPACPRPAGRGAGQANPSLIPSPDRPQHPYPLEPGSPYLPPARGKRSVSDLRETGTLDVGTQLSALELDDRTDYASIPGGLPTLRTYTAVASEGYCISPAALGTLGALGLVLLVVMLSAAVYTVACRRK